MTNVTQLPRNTDPQIRAIDLNHEAVMVQAAIQKDSIALAHITHFFRTVVWAVCTVSVTWLITSTIVQVASQLR